MIYPLEYKGFPTYATWRVYTELYECMNPAELFPYVKKCQRSRSISYLAEKLKENADEYLGTFESDTAHGWAQAFLSDVHFNWIAERMLNEYHAKKDAA